MKSDFQTAGPIASEDRKTRDREHWLTLNEWPGGKQALA
jgi:hypothetical protein